MPVHTIAADDISRSTTTKFSNGNIHFVRQYDSNDWPHGENYENFKSGQLRVTCEYNHGVRHGPYNIYYESGTLLESYICVNNEIHGEYKRFYESGQIRNHGFFSHGTRFGEDIHFDEDGKILVHRFIIDSKTSEPRRTFIRRRQRITNDEIVTLTLMFGRNFVNAPL